MRALVASAPDDWTVTDVAEPVANPDEVTIQVEAAGVCGTDLHTLAGHNTLVRYPVVPGHEFAGTVVEVGAAVAHLSIGDRVAVDPSRQCEHCRWCIGGRPNLCPDKGGYGSRYPGGFAERVAVRATSCVRLPTTVSTLAGALAEPLACAIHGADRLGPVLGEHALVYGAGPVGLLLITLLRNAGAASVDVVEPSPQRRAGAGDFGARRTVADPAELPETPWTVVVDATGASAAITDALRRIDRGGRFLMMGVAPQETVVPMSPFEIYRRELTILGSMAVLATFDRAVSLLGHRVVDESLVTHTFSLDHATEAVATIRSGIGRKVMLLPGRTKTNQTPRENQR